MKGSDFMFDYANRLFYNCHRMSFNLSGSYIDFREWIKKTKKTNLQNSDDKSFQYVVAVELNHENIGKNTQKE